MKNAAIRILALLIGMSLASAAEEGKPPHLAYLGRPAVNVPLAAQAPAMDGKLDDAAWAQAPLLSIAEPNNGERGLRHRAEARLVSTREALYVGVRCFDTDAAHATAAVTNRDGPVWRDDSMEMFVKPGENPAEPYAQFTINPKGVVFDAYNVTDGFMPVAVDSKWDAAGLRVASGIESNAWTMEVMIPFADLKLPADTKALAQGWRFDIFRVRQGRDREDAEESAWVPTLEKTSQVPSAFGYLFFEAFGGRCPPLAAPATAGVPTAAAFVRKPAVTRNGERVRIAFAVNQPTDVAVAIEDAKGEVVRHLVAGVLGPNAPAPLQPGLSQEVEWDGKDDAGRQVPEVRGQRSEVRDQQPEITQRLTPATQHRPPFSVRVSLGLQPSLQKLIGSDPSVLGTVKALACGPGGEVFVFHSYGRQHFGDHSTACAVFGRDGKYRRTVSPYPARLPDDKLMGVRRLTREDGERVPFIYHIETRAHLPGLGDLPEQHPVVTRDGRLAFVGLREKLEYSSRAGEPWVTVMHTDGSVPTRGTLFTRLLPFQNSGACLALAPDDKTVYATGIWVGSASGAMRGRVTEWPMNAVYRFGWDDREARVFLGKPDTRGDGEAEFNAPQGVATDASGNIYVADRGNNRISVFQPDGKPLARIPVWRPQRVEVHRKTGAIYALSGSDQAAQIIKLDGYQTARVVARKPLSSSGLMALDDSAEPPLIWLSSETAKGTSILQNVEDQGDHFGESTELSMDLVRNKEPRSACDVRSMSLDRRNGWLYIGNYWRYRVADGQWEKLPQPKGSAREWPGTEPGSTIGVAGQDGNYYMNLGYNSPLLLRYGPDLQPRPYETMTHVPFHLNHNAPVTTNEYPAIGGFQLCHGQGHTADAAGNVYALWAKTPREPGDGWRATALYRYDVTGHCVKEKLVNSSMQCLYSIRVDPAGNLYLAMGLRKGKSQVPAGLLGQIPDQREDGEADAGMNGYPLIYGSIVKFGPEGGQIGEKIGGVECRYGHDRAIEVKGARWISSEASPVPSWNMPKGEPGTLNICTCDPYFFDVDGFGRSFFADAARCRVGVLDTNGNLIRWFGTYGNADSSMGTNTGEIGFCWPQSVAVGDRAAYVSDRLNRRIVAVSLNCAAVETVAIPGP